MKVPSLIPALTVAALLSASFASAAGPTKQECVTANSDAQDLRRAGKMREAREKLAVCVVPSCPGPVREDCAQRLDEVDRSMPSIVFDVKDGGGNDVTASRVTMDGEALADKLDGTALQVDPGEHRFTFFFEDTNGVVRLDKTIVVREGEKDRHVRVELGGASAVGPASVRAMASTADAGTDGNTQRMLALVVGGAGAIGLVVGSAFGLIAKSTYDHALQAECGNTHGSCSTQGAQDGQRAHSQAAVSTVSFVAGGALLAGGAVLYFTAPKASAVVAATVGTNGAGLCLKGAW